MNIIELQEKLKDLPDQRLTQEMQSPSGSVPQFLVLNELNRRKRMRDDMKAMSAQPTATVAQEAIASAGVPAGGIADMAQMAPRSSIAQNTGIASVAPQPMPADPSIAQGMYRGGMVRRMYGGGPVRRMQQGGPTSQPVIVKSGITYYLQPDGTYISADGRRTFSDVGTNLSNFASGIMGAIGLTPGAGSAPQTSIIRDGRVYYLQSDGTYLSGDGRRLSDVGTNLRNFGSDLEGYVSNIGQDIASALTPSPPVARPFDPSLSPQFSEVPAGAVDRPFGLPTTNRQLDAIIASQNAVPDLSDAAAMQFGQTPAGEMPPRNSSVLNDMARRAQILAGNTSNMMPTGGPGTFPVPEMGRTAGDDLNIRRRLFSSETPPEAQQSVDGMTGYVPPSDGTASGDMAVRNYLTGGGENTALRIYRETLDRYLPETAPSMPGLPGLQQPAAADMSPYLTQPANAPAGSLPPPFGITPPNANIEAILAMRRGAAPPAAAEQSQRPFLSDPGSLSPAGMPMMPQYTPDAAPSVDQGMYIPDRLSAPRGPTGMPMTSTGPLTVPAPGVSPTASTSDEAMRQFEENFGIGGGTGISFTLPQGDMSGFAEDSGMLPPVDNLPGLLEQIFGADAIKFANQYRPPASLPVIDAPGGRGGDDLAFPPPAAETPEDTITSARPDSGNLFYADPSRVIESTMIDAITSPPMREGGPSSEEGTTQPAPSSDDQLADVDSGAAAEEIISGGGQPSGGATSGIAGAAPASATSGIAGAAPASATSYEQEILNAIQRQEQRAEQDKWLALAQVGLGMMTSRSPTFLGAVGEGGAAGIQALMGARNANEDRRMELVQALEEYRMMQADRAAARARAGRGRAGPTPAQMRAALVAEYEFAGNAISNFYDEYGQLRTDISDQERANLLALQAYQSQTLSRLIPPPNMSDPAAQ